MVLTDDVLIAATIATEVPPLETGAFTTGMIALARTAVAECIHNRALDGRFGGSTPRLVVLAPKQFSAVLREEYWFKAVLGLWFPAHVAACRAAWANVRTTGRPILYYYSPISMVPKDAVPGWVNGLVEIPRPGIDREYFRFYGRP